jgi:hypothetical protein
MVGILLREKILIYNDLVGGLLLALPPDGDAH